MKTRLHLKHKWWTSQYANPVFLYYDMDLECFEVGSRSTASKHKFEFTDDELEQLKKDYDLSEFAEERLRGEVSLFEGNYEDFCKEIDKIAKDAKSVF